MRIAILGPLAVTGDDGGDVPVGGARLRALLIRLALDAGRTVSTDALVDAVWADDPPPGAGNALQTLVSRLRRALPAGAVTAAPTGYRVDAVIDVAEFDAHLRAGRSAAVHEGPAAARDAYTAALALWRGEPLSDVAGAEFARAPIARLTEAWIGAQEERLAAAAVLGERGLIAELEAFAAAHPLRERPHQLLIGALAAAGRAGDAVATYQRFRDRLADQLGLDPSPTLTEAYAAMLRGEPAGTGSAGTGSAGTLGAARDGPSDPAAGRALGNLRPSLTSFVGRDAEAARLTAMVREHRLVSLVGPGGAGKTRLATEVGHALAGEFSGGVWMVELAPVRVAEEVPRALAEALQLRESRFLESPGGFLDAGGDPLRRVLDPLGAKDLLLILDNCEHLVDACARVVEEVLTTCPGVRVLSTTREPLAITSEALCALGPLATPPIAAMPDEIATAPSVRLFTDRAAAVRAGFALDEATRPAVAEICRRLDGMPLAIELACARLRTMPVEQIAARLDDRFRLLTGGSRTALPRHQTLVAVVEWSWELLDPAERDLAQRFSVFLDGATIDAVTEVCGAESVDALVGLVDKSFVSLGDDERYRMLETIRAFAVDRLTEAGGTVDARQVHAEYFTRLAEEAEARLRGPEQMRWLRWLRAERDNLAGALRWTIDSADAPRAVQLAGALGWFWLVSDYHAEAAGWLGQALALVGDPAGAGDAARAAAAGISPAVFARALAHHGINVSILESPTKGLPEIDRAARLAPDLPIVVLSRLLAGIFADDRDITVDTLPEVLGHPDRWVRAMGITVQGIVHMFDARPDEAEQRLYAAIAEFEQLGDQWAKAMVSGALGELRAIRGDTTGAVETLTFAAELAESLTADDIAAQSLLQLALVRARSGDLVGAQREIDRARVKARSAHVDSIAIWVGIVEAEVRRREGDLVTARARYADGLAQLEGVRGTGHEIHAGALAGLAVTEHELGHREPARAAITRLHGLVRTWRERPVAVIAALATAAIVLDEQPVRAAFLIGVADALRGMRDQGNPDVDRLEAAARAALGEGAFTEAYEKGRAVDLDGGLGAMEL